MSTEGKIPVKKERLNKSANCFEMSFFRRNNILWGILFGPEALLELREDMNYGDINSVFHSDKISADSDCWKSFVSEI